MCYIKRYAAAMILKARRSSSSRSFSFCFLLFCFFGSSVGKVSVCFCLVSSTKFFFFLSLDVFCLLGVLLLIQNGMHFERENFASVCSRVI
ncbi:hypothetical protein BRADI_4g28333v3 [Brachypodium distachyon]|uniref:Uncharacterized protein n=1 Tax=Brachypodium distachyon TaxID=15368 RepID=A0A0Q3ER38_BRADI|nr:hypothetical protein BRADI_4g28333v3 [Brachypodium distachyon]